MSAKTIHVPEGVAAALDETAALLGGLPREQLLDAAVRGFGELPPPCRALVIRAFWLDGPPRRQAARPRATFGGTIRELVHAVFAKILPARPG